MATYGGVDIFQRPFSIVHTVNPSAQQLNEFFGVSGQQSLWGGQRGRTFLATGMLFAPTAVAINAMESQFASYAGDGIARVLVDTRGRAWEQVLCESFAPDGRVKADPTYGYYVTYKAVFRGLV